MSGPGAGEPTALDLFCGAGGMSAGLADAGLRVAGAVDSWSVAVDTYRLNFPDHRAACLDLRGSSFEAVAAELGLEGRPDVVVGGPPCQGFSIQRIGSDSDDRNNLVLEFARLVAEARPRLYLMENVLGLVGKRGQALVEAFTRYLRSQGYTVESIRANAAEYGLPQVRWRVFFYGWPVGDPPFGFPPPTHAAGQFRTVWDAIGDLPSPPTEAPADPLHRRTKLSPTNLLRLKYIPPGGGFESLPPELRVNCHKNGAARIGHRYVYGRLAPAAPAATITARFDSFTRGKFAHPFEDRNITLREGARLQGFPDDFEFRGTQEEIAALIGNAVPPPLAAVIGKGVAAYLRGEQGDRREHAAQLALFHGA